MTDLVLIANAKDSTIAAFDLDGERLAPRATSPLPGACSTFVVDEARDLVYAGCKPGPGMDAPAVVTLRLDRATGELTEIGRRACLGAPTSVALAHDGSVLLLASYSGGVGQTWPVADGRLGEPAAELRAANLHCVIATADGAHAYFVSLGEDAVHQFALDASGALTALAAPTASLPAGCGARHLILSRDERSGYLVTEFSGEVFRLDRAASGELTAAESLPIFDPDAGLKHSVFGADPRAEGLIWGADVHLAASGVFLLASERNAGTIATVALEAGRLGRVVALSPCEPQPRGFVVAPDGARVIVPGETVTTASLYRLGADGRLAPLDQVETGHGANWVRVVKN